MKYNKLSLNKLAGYEVVAEQHDVLRFPIGTNIQQTAVANVTIRVEGEADVYYGNEQEPGKTLRAGTTSIEGDWARISHYDEFRLKVTTPTYRYYCIRDHQNRHLNPATLRCNGGETATVAANKNVFIATGAVQVGGLDIRAPGQFFTSAQDVDVQVTETALMVLFDRVE